MKLFRLFSLFMIVVMVFGLSMQPTAAKAPQAEPQQAGIEKIEADLLVKFAQEGAVDFIVRFANQADLAPAYSMSWADRGEFVFQALTEAALVQDAAKVTLDNRGLKHETFIAGNDLYVFKGTQTDAVDLAALTEVGSIRATQTYSITPADKITLNSSNIPLVQPDALAWGISYTHADQFWTAFSVQGDGIKVANIDTGVQYNHPALDQAFACASPTDPACWSDPENWCGAGGACDNNGHGTHTMGTMVADDDPALTWQAGMAPNSTWIACKGCGTSSCSDFALNSCANWILAPGGSTDNRPNVVNNSWGGTPDGDPWYEANVQAWRAAGIFPAFSAGNSGPGCGTLGDPGSYASTFASGMINASGIIDGGSSRGPSAFGAFTKPNISAPGVSVCSTIPGNGWSCGYTGTSMASPHTAGAVALLWSCNPALVGQIDVTAALLQTTAGDAPAGACGTSPDGGDYAYGYGYLDVLAAGVSTCGGVAIGSIEGHVYEADGVTPIEGVNVSASPAAKGSGNQIDALTDPNGFYSMQLVVGTYDVTASKAGYTSQTATGVAVLDGQTTTQDFSLNFLGTWNPGPSMCFDLTRIDAEFFPATGLVYILGGRGGADGSLTDGNIYSFNPVTNACLDTGANMPFPISNYTINLVNDGTADVLCTFGGRGSAGASILNVQCYNPLTNTATNVGNLPAAYNGFTPGAQAVVGNMVYIFGGFRNTAAPYELARTDRWDPETNSFTQIGDLSLGRAYLDAAVVDGAIYAFGGTVFDGTNLTAQTRAEVMADPGGAGTWNDAAVTDLPVATAEGRAFGFDSGSGYELANQIVIAAGGQWPAETAEAFVYDIATDTYDYSFPDLVVPRRDAAGVFVPLDSPDPTDGTPAMWVLGGRSGTDVPPYAGPEFYPVQVSAVAEPDITITPASLSATQAPDTTTTQPLEICNVGDDGLDWSMVEGESVAQGASTPSNNSTAKFAENTGRPPVPERSHDPLAIVLDEGFEAGAVPPAGWTLDVTNPGFTWKLMTLGTPFEGLYSADIEYDPDLVPQDEVLLTPEVNITNGVLDFWSFGSLYWCRDTVDNCDLNVWIVVGDWDGGAADDIYVGMADGDWTDTWVWSNSTFDLTSLLPGGPVRIGFQYTGVDGAEVALDNIILDVAVDIPWLSEAPTSGTVAPGACTTVNVTFDSTGLADGLYTANLIVTSNDPDTPEITVPVSLTVEQTEFLLYLPIVFKP